MMTAIYKDIIYRLLNGDIEYNSSEWGEAVNKLLEIEKLHNESAIYILKLLDDSDDYSVIICLAFILSNLSYGFIIKNKLIIKEIILNSMRKKSWRANVDLIPVYVNLLESEEDYLQYWQLINSSNEVVNSVAISYLLSFSEEKIHRLTEVSDFNFESFFIKTEMPEKKEFLSDTKEKSCIYKKIKITLLYKWNKDKRKIYSITNGDYELFEYIFIYLIDF